MRITGSRVLAPPRPEGTGSGSGNREADQTASGQGRPKVGETRSAEHIVWDAPGGVQMSLIPEPGGSLQVEAAAGVVTITGEHCRHFQGEEAKKPSEVAHQILAEVHLTILTNRCQITWKSVVNSEGV